MVHFEQTIELARVWAYARLRGQLHPSRLWKFKDLPTRVVEDLRTLRIEPTTKGKSFWIHLDFDATRLPQWFATMSRERAMEVCEFIIRNSTPQTIVPLDEQPVWLALFNTINYEIEFRQAIYFSPVGKRPEPKMP